MSSTNFSPFGGGRGGHYFKIALRNLRKNKIYSIINICGLAIGLTCSMLIAAFVVNELSYDRYPKNAADIYRVNVSVAGNGDIAVYPDVDEAVGEGMRRAFPSVKASTRISPVTDYVKFQDKQFKETQMAFADSNFLEVFSIPLLEGNDKNALVEPHSVVISRAFAKKYFGNEDALGKSLRFGTFNELFKVTGIIDKVPPNSHFHFDAFLSLSTRPSVNHTWSNLGYYTYLLLQKKTDPKNLEAMFPRLVARYVVPEVQHDMGVSLAEAQKTVSTFRFSLQPLTSIHLHGTTRYELEANGDIQYVYIFSALAVFILLLACANFTNLSTASGVKRAREVGIRKAIGSIRKQLILQFLSESVLFTLFAMACAYVLLFLLLPYFNQLANREINFRFFLELPAVLTVLILSVVVGALAGVYPAFFLSSFRAVKVLKGPALTSQKKPLQSGLIVFQFCISTALIIATITAYQQLQYMQNKKLGYDKDQVLFLPDTRLLGNNEEAFEQTITKDSRVVSASISRYVPGSSFIDGTEIYPRNENSNGTEIHGNIYHIDYDYLQTLGIHLARGRNFSKTFSTDSSSGVIINEAAVKQLGWSNDNAVGKTLVRSGQQQFTVIGVVQDFHYASVKQSIAPLLLLLGHNHGGLILKIKSSGISNFLSFLKKQWDQFNAAGPLEYSFLDEKFAKLYAGERRTQQIFSVFSGLAVIVAGLGLFGLSAFVIGQRTKEIGVRKVLGASIQSLLLLVSKEFLVLVLIAFVIAAPLGWWVMNKWLEDFAYRINISGWVFVLAAIISLGVAMATISFQAVRAAIANPVKSLRTE